MSKLVGFDYKKFKALSDGNKVDALYKYLCSSDDKITMSKVGDSIGIDDYSVSCVMRYYGWSGRNAGALRAMPLIEEDFERIVKDCPKGFEDKEQMIVILKAYVLERQHLDKKCEDCIETDKSKSEDGSTMETKNLVESQPMDNAGINETIIVLDVRIVYIVVALVLFALYTLIEGSDIVSSAINSLIVALGVVAGSYIGTKILMKVGKKDGKK